MTVTCVISENKTKLTHKRERGPILFNLKKFINFFPKIDLNLIFY